MFGWITKTDWNIERVMALYKEKGLMRYEPGKTHSHEGQ